jgi:hypothetical protein
MVAVKRRRVEAAVRLDRPAILAEFDGMLSHDNSALDPVGITSDHRSISS